MGSLGAPLGALSGALGRHSGPRRLLGRPGKRFWTDFGSILKRFGVDFRLFFSNKSVFELAFELRRRSGQMVDFCQNSIKFLIRVGVSGRVSCKVLARISIQIRRDSRNMVEFGIPIEKCGNSRRCFVQNADQIS